MKNSGISFLKFPKTVSFHNINDDALSKSIIKRAIGFRIEIAFNTFLPCSFKFYTQRSLSKVILFAFILKSKFVWLKSQSYRDSNEVPLQFKRTQFDIAYVRTVIALGAGVAIDSTSFILLLFTATRGHELTIRLLGVSHVENYRQFSVSLFWPCRLIINTKLL